MVMMKNKLMLMLVLVVLVLVWAWPAAALAANVPVYLEGERVATAVEREGDYFVPLRTMLELCGYQAHWNEEEQCVWAVLDNSEFFYVREGRDGYFIERIDPDRPEEIQLLGGMHYFDGSEDALVAFMLNGQMYMNYNSAANVLGLDRELAEGETAIYYSLYEPHVDYTDPENGVKFDLNLHSGQLLLNGQELAVLDLPYYDTKWSNVRIWPERTPGGNYVLHYSYEGWNVKGRPLRADYFINATGGAVHRTTAPDCWQEFLFNAYLTLPETVYSDGTVWLSGTDGVWRLEDKPGAGAKVEVLQLLPKVQALGLPLQQAYCYWTDGRYMLLGDGYYFAFYDSQENKGLDLQPLLLSDGSAELLNQFLLKSAPQVYNEAELSAFWQRIRLPENTDDEVSRPWLHYDHCTEGVFYFELHYISYAHAPHRNGGSYTVSLGLQQLKEML